MPQVNSTVSDEIWEMLDLVCKATGESKSGLVREYIRRGAYQDLEGLNRLNTFRKTLQQQAKESQTEED